MKSQSNSSFQIHIYKEYLNFSASHFLIFDNGEREPLHGHNYRVRFRGRGLDMNHSDMLFDFLDIKPLIRKICDRLDHKLLLPKENNLLKWKINETQIEIQTPEDDFFSIPVRDVLLLPLPNISAERLAQYLFFEIKHELWNQFQFKFRSMEVEVEESPGQSAVFQLEDLD